MDVSARILIAASSLVLACYGGAGRDPGPGSTTEEAGTTAATSTSTSAAATTGASEESTAVTTAATTTATTTATTGAVAQGPTWHRDIAPLLHGHCQPCHTGPEPLAPFSLLEYEVAAPLAKLLAEATQEARMPPFPAAETAECHPRFTWKSDLRLHDEEKKLLADWAAAGAPEGDPADAGDLPGPPDSSLVGANREIKIGAAWTQPQASGDMYRCFSMDAEVLAPSWITGVEVVPGNAAIVHHVAVLVDPGGTTVMNDDGSGSYNCFSGGLDGTVMAYIWAPGTQALDMPENSGLPVPVGSRVVMQIHYHSNSVMDEVDDATTARLRTTEVAPARTVAFAAYGATTPDTPGLLTSPFIIPAGAVGHVESYASALDFEAPEVRLWSVWPHMHLAGSDMKIDLTRAAFNAAQPQQECLVQTPHWDFHFQRNYLYDLPFDALPTIRDGDGLQLRCTFDNNVTNDNLVEALMHEQKTMDANEVVFADVSAGEGSLDEMCAVLLGVVY